VKEVVAVKSVDAYNHLYSNEETDFARVCSGTDSLYSRTIGDKNNDPPCNI
jgi:hypothetical protein